MKQIFVHGFFHADPHPGNIFILPDNVICYLDFGMMGRIGRQTREDFADLIMSVVRQDESGAANALLKLTIWDEEPEQGLEGGLLKRDGDGYLRGGLWCPGPEHHLPDIQGAGSRRHYRWF